MPKETAAQKRTRISLLLADYDAQSRELRKLVKSVETLKEQVKAIEPGTYGDFIRSQGTPREVLDQAKVREMFKDEGRDLPTKMTDPPVIVTFAPGGKA